MAYRITDACVACGTCIGECPVEAISAGDIYVIDPDKCIDFLRSSLTTLKVPTGQKLLWHSATTQKFLRHLLKR